MRIPLIAANWKMNTTITEAISLVKAIQPELDKVTNVEKVGQARCPERLLSE